MNGARGPGGKEQVVDTIIAILQPMAVFAVGLAARVGVVLGVMAVLATPGLVVLGAVRTVRWARRRAHT